MTGNLQAPGLCDQVPRETPEVRMTRLEKRMYELEISMSYLISAMKDILQGPAGK